MTNLKDLRAKPDKITLSNGMELEVYSLSLSKAADYAELVEKKKYSEAMKFIIIETVMRALPDAEEEDIEFLNKDDLAKITRAALKANGFGEEDDESPKPEPQETSNKK